VTVEAGAGAVSYQTIPVGEAAPVGQPLAVALGEESLAPATAVRTWPGGRIEHTLTAANNGPGLARQVQLVEKLPPELEILTGTISHAGRYDPARHTIIWELGDLAAGDSVVRSYTLLAPLTLQPAWPVADNRAELRSPDAPTVTAASATEIEGEFQLAAVKLAPAEAEPGRTIEYRIRVQNVNPNALDQVVITDPLPEYTAYLTGTASLPPEFGLDGRTLRWNLGLLAPGEIREVSFSVTVAADVPDWYSRLTNEAAISYTGGTQSASATTLLPTRSLPTVTPTATAAPADDGGDEGGDGPDPPSSGPETPVLHTGTVVPPWPLTPTVTTGPAVSPTPTPLPQPALGLTVSTDTVRAGQVSLVTWRLTFTNPTPLRIGDLTVRDLLPPGLLYLAAEASQGQTAVSPRASGSRDTRLLLLTPAATSAG